MSRHPEFEYSERPTFFQRFGVIIGVLAVVGVVAALFGNIFSKGSAKPPKRQELVMVSLPQPPAPLPPPPPPQQTPLNTPREEMIEQTEVDEQETKPAEDAPSAPTLGTNIQGSGPPDGFGLGGNRSGNSVGGGTGGRAGSRFGWYAAQVQKTLAEALRIHPRTRNADFIITVRIWPDASGRIVRAKLAGTTGDSQTDTVITNEILPGLQLTEPPPPGMRLPIVMRFTARRPS